MLVAAKCTQCGANIQVDSTREAGICPHCGTAFITEKAVNNYNTTYVTNNTYNSVTNINGGEVHIHNDVESADQLFQKIKDTIAGTEVLSTDILGAPVGTLGKNIEIFEQRYPLDPRNEEINILISLRGLRDLYDQIVMDPRKEYSLETERWRRSLNSFEKVNAEGAKRYRALFLEKLNYILSKNYGKPIEGGMFDLKCKFYDFGKTVERELQHREDKRKTRMEENEAPARKNDLSAPQVIVPSVKWPNFFDQGFTDLLAKGKTMLSDTSQGYDGEFLLYLFNAAEKALVSPYLEEGDYEEVQTALNEFVSAIRTVLRKEDAARASVKEIFYDSRRADYEYLWKRYAAAIAGRDTKEAERIIRRLAFGYDSKYAYHVYKENFKDGLFGIRHYKQKVPDRDVQALCERTLAEDYKEFMEKRR